MSPRIAIAVATRGRPRMRGACLESLGRLVLPEGEEVVFLLVENDTELSIGDEAEQLGRRVGPPHRAEALLESRQGIPFARNRALDRAAELGCDWLLFVDDDEVVAEDWLTAHLRAAATQGFDLAAGPVEQRPPDAPLSPSEQAVFDYLDAEGARRRRRREASLADGTAGNNDLATNNWIGRVAALTDAGLRFDEGMRHTGGSDTDLSRRARAAGLTLGWVPDAVVSETIPKDRLTPRYIYDRSRSQTLAKYHIRYRKGGRPGVVRPLADALIKGLVGSLRYTAGSFGNHRLQLKGLRSLGVAAGWLQGIAGRRSDLYETQQGD